MVEGWMLVEGFEGGKKTVYSICMRFQNLNS